MLYRGDYDGKRDFARMGLECPATFKREGEGATYHAIATDLSATGLQLNGSDAINVGTVVMVEMTPEQAIVPPLQAKAEVVRYLKRVYYRVKACVNSIYVQNRVYITILGEIATNG